MIEAAAGMDEAAEHAVIDDEIVENKDEQHGT